MQERIHTCACQINMKCVQYIDIKSFYYLSVSAFFVKRRKRVEMEAEGEMQIPVQFTTKLDAPYKLPESSIVRMI